MESKTFKVTNMTCNGCVSTVRSEIEQITSVANVVHQQGFPARDR